MEIDMATFSRNHIEKLVFNVISFTSYTGYRIRVVRHMDRI